MTVAIPQLKIDGLLVPLQANVRLTQTYEWLEGTTILRTLNGRGVQQVHWRKLKTTLSGGGWAPTSLVELDRTVSHDLACVAPRSIDSAVNTITLPAARRTDHAPLGFALMPSGLLVVTPLSLVGDVATLTPVTDALQYRVQYLPLLTVFIKPSESLDRSSAEFQWQFEAEEE